jgi:hypothetical protein
MALLPDPDLIAAMHERLDSVQPAGLFADLWASEWLTGQLVSAVRDLVTAHGECAGCAMCTELVRALSVISVLELNGTTPLGSAP